MKSVVTELGSNEQSAPLEINVSVYGLKRSTA